jgi:hypothetical protein
MKRTGGKLLRMLQPRRLFLRAAELDQNMPTTARYHALSEVAQQFRSQVSPGSPLEKPLM